MTTDIVHLSIGTIDRATHLRKDRQWLAARLTADDSAILLLHRGNPAVQGDPPGLRLFSPGEVPPSIPLEGALFLGVGERGSALFALAVECPPAGADDFRDFRSVLAILPRTEGALVAYARGMVHWHQRHRFCGGCGTETVAAEAGHVRHCPGCSTDQYPRTDPAVIVLVTWGDRVLLGRQSVWAAGVYSILAGFVEPGESLEEAVRREVKEESGVVVGPVIYRASQPWPFPSSLMLGFRGEALETTIEVDREELEDARWISRQDLFAAVASGEMRLPSPGSIARQMVEEWLVEKSPV